MSKFVKEQRKLERSANKQDSNLKRSYKRDLNKLENIHKNYLESMNRLELSFNKDMKSFKDLSMVKIYDQFIDNLRDQLKKLKSNKLKEEVIYSILQVEAMFNYNLIFNLEFKENIDIKSYDEKLKLASKKLDRDLSGLRLSLKQSKLYYDFKKYIDIFLIIFFDFIIDVDVEVNKFFINQIISNIGKLSSDKDEEINNLTYRNLENIINKYIIIFTDDDYIEY